jgi:glycosyltransferase involved in cell wall biosynthesis
MQILLIHQNFPGQFRALAPQLVARGHSVVAIGQQPLARQPEGLRYLHYAWDVADPPRRLVDPDLELNLQRATRVHRLALQLREQGFKPDAVIFHSGWGEGLYLRDLWPRAVLLAYPELYARPELLGYDFDPDLGAPGEGLRQSMQRQNFMALAAIADADGAVVPTVFQRDTFPAHLRGRFHVIHEGVDLEAVKPNPNRHVQLTETLMLRRGDPVITFVNRTLEPLRGFRALMRALPQIQAQHPTAQTLIVGDALGSSYSPASSHPQGYQGEMLALLGHRLDRSRLHFLGRVSYGHLLGLLQISAAHVYLTYPYALSWSLLEAMACGAPVVGSANDPVTEVLRDRENGRLVPFNDPDHLAGTVLDLLKDGAQGQRLGEAARRTVEQRYRLDQASDAYEQLILSLKLSATRA